MYVIFDVRKTPLFSSTKGNPLKIKSLENNGSFLFQYESIKKEITSYSQLGIIVTSKPP